MKQLLVLGLDQMKSSVVCADDDKKALYTLPIDQTLRNAVAGDLDYYQDHQNKNSRAEISVKEIQNKIRYGQTIEAISENFHVKKNKVERYAHPVLLERERMASVAQQSHLLRSDGPTIESLLTLVSSALAAKGQDTDDLVWDAWKHDDKYWIVAAQWQVGQSVNTAHWKFKKDVHGGCSTELDDAAMYLTNPDHVNVFHRNNSSDVEEEYEEKSPPPQQRPLRALRVSSEKESSSTQHTKDKSQESKPVDFFLRSPGATAPVPQKSRARSSVPSWEDVLLGVKGKK